MSDYGYIMKLKGELAMKEINYIRETETESEMGDKIYLCYFIEQMSDEASESGKRYGVGIDMYEQKPGERTNRVRKSARGIFKTKVEAELFIELLCKNYVTPTTLYDIVEDSVFGGNIAL